MLDEKTGIVGTAEERGLPAQSKADGTEDGGFTGPIGAYNYIEPVLALQQIVGEFCGPMPREGTVHLNK